MAGVIWPEAEQFDKTGGWSNDSQFVDLMGSPYLLATGLAVVVAVRSAFRVSHSAFERVSPFPLSP